LFHLHLYLGVYRDNEFNGVNENCSIPTPVAMVTKKLRTQLTTIRVHMRIVYVFHLLLTCVIQTCFGSGVFVLVTIGLSTVSVVTSIIIIRLSGVSTPLPSWVRLSCFRVVARLMCVRFSHSSKSTVAPLDDQRPRSTTRLVGAEDLSLASADKPPTSEANGVGGKIDELLSEVRKVRC